MQGKPAGCQTSPKEIRLIYHEGHEGHEDLGGELHALHELHGESFGLRISDLG
jgi:hypothetical protein